ncbi:MAG: hypothetical protein H6720_14570 [Sandaracinus sp.]|nr:hypothetical protein [Sandaracinus sp.]
MTRLVRTLLVGAALSTALPACLVHHRPGGGHVARGGDHDRGHGNDADGHDSDNPGRGHGRGRGRH